jgi:endonuclease/exonuclease/phosphatase family metal-dependent hydrolase
MPTITLRSVVLLACSAVVAAGCASARRAAPTSRHELRVLVYNIHAGKDAAGGDNLARVADLVRSTSADVVLLQEVDRGTERSGRVDQPAALARRTGFSPAFGRTLDYQGGEYGIAVLSRWPIVATDVVHLPVEPPQQRAGGSYEPRGALRVTVAAPWGPLLVMNTHLDPSRDDGYRRQEVRTILRLADSARASGAAGTQSAVRLLVGGDFNSTPESAVQDTLRRGGLRDAWAECGRGDGLTYPADSAVKRIDYLFLTGAATCAGATVPRSDASDHRPLLVRVTLP